MNGPGADVLASACFATDENSKVGVGDNRNLLDLSQQRCTLADKVFKTSVGLQYLGGMVVFGRRNRVDPVGKAPKHLRGPQWHLPHVGRPKVEQVRQLSRGALLDDHDGYASIACSPARLQQRSDDLIRRKMFKGEE